MRPRIRTRQRTSDSGLYSLVAMWHELSYPPCVCGDQSQQTSEAVSMPSVADLVVASSWNRGLCASWQMVFTQVSIAVGLDRGRGRSTALLRFSNAASHP